MPRLIDADELVRNIDELSKDAGFYKPIYEWFSKRIKDAPTIDAVTVVRCKDCRHFAHQENGGFCTVFSGYYLNVRFDDDFCSYGERKDCEG